MWPQHHWNKQIRKIIERHFLSACISKSSAHHSLKLHTVNCQTLHSTMWQFEHDMTNSHRGINKTFGVEECWSYIKYSCITSGWPPLGKLIHNVTTPIVIMWPIRQHDFTSAGFICIILLLFVRPKVNRSNFTTGHFALIGHNNPLDWLCV